MTKALDVENSVQSRYAEGAKKREESLCCPVDYSSELLAMLPQEIIDKDYGCGDPSRYVKSGDVVLDLGSGGGKICYMAAQLVGDSGRVMGVDMTDDMLALAKKYQAQMAEKIGGDRVVFHKGFIQDLSLDVSKMNEWLAQNPVDNDASLLAFKAWQKAQDSMIADNSVSLVISNCVLNLVDKADRTQMISDIYRVLKPGGRVAIADIISDEVAPMSMQNNPELWSGCISGAFEEQEFLQAFVAAGFEGVAYDKWDEAPWQVVEGIEFRSVTLTAVKPFGDQQYDAGQALMYKGPFASITDDAGRVFEKGKRVAVSNTTYQTVIQSSLKEHFVGFEPQEPINLGCFSASDSLPKTRDIAMTKNSQQKSFQNSCC